MPILKCLIKGAALPPFLHSSTGMPNARAALILLFSIQMSAAYLVVPALRQERAWKQVQATRHLIEKNKERIVSVINKQRHSPAQYDALEHKFIDLIRLDDELHALLSRLVVAAVQGKFSARASTPGLARSSHQSARQSSVDTW